MLEARAVNFAYLRGQPVLNDINCTIRDGEFVALVGYNGSGKTTLSRLFMALCHPRSGQVLLDGEDLADREPADLAGKMGYVFQNPDLQILEDTVFDEVAYGPRVRKLPEELVCCQTREALAATGLTGLERAYPRLLSFGQKRRLGVATALALNPHTLILDEITNGQDALEQARMMEYLSSINQKRRTTILLITHDMDIVRSYTQRAIVLYNGSIVFDGASSRLFDGSMQPERWGLRTPAVSCLAAALGVQAATAAELCAALTRKESDA